MTDNEKLDLILAKCRANLALAEKRSTGESGKWFSSEYLDDGRFGVITDTNDIIVKLGAGKHNSDFIAACAGSAEAGWRSTIAAIDLFRTMETYGSDELSDRDSRNGIAAILGAWRDLV